MKRLFVTMLVAAWPNLALADGLDVGQWLRRPGVKMLAVEFYATWCEPCMEAVPRWKALHEKYRKDGLRLVVVATQDPQGGCVNPGWNPDDVVCDDDGRLAERFGAARLPSAYLWTWDGALLVRQQHVDEVETQIERWLEGTPRVAVKIGDIGRGANVKNGTLEDLVRARLRDEDKMTVIASDTEQKRLDALTKKSLSAKYDERLQCEVGMALSANSLLEASVNTGRRSLLRLGLSSVERGCLVASAVVDWNKKKPAVSVAEAVAELMSKLRQAPTMPWTRNASGAPTSGVSSYEKMARELEANKAAAKHREEAWAVVRTFANSTSIDRTRRADALNQFLRDFPRDNPHEDEARRLLAGLTPVSRSVPPPTAAKKPTPRPKPSTLRSDVAPSVRRLLSRPAPPKKIGFATGKAQLKRKSFAFLDLVAAALERSPTIRVLEISGHTDSRGASGRNARLSKRRAESVLEYLVTKGIDRRRLRAVGHGEDKPVVSNATKAGRRQNRRIEFRIVE